MSSVEDYGKLVELKSSLEKSIAVDSAKLVDLGEQVEALLKELGVETMKEVEEKHKELTEKYDLLMEEAKEI